MPRVSVLIPAYHSSSTLTRCLEALQQQTFRDLEVVLVNSSQEPATADLVRRRFPDVRFEQAPARMLPHAARNRAVQLASGELLVFTDPDCYMSPDVVERLLAAHDNGHTVVGGALENAGRGWWELGVHFAKFAWWLPGGEPQARPDLPTAIVAYSRAVWEQAGPFDGQCWCGDSMLVERYIRSSGVPWFEPRAVVHHQHLSGVPAFLRERYSRGADYGANRPVQRRWSRLRIAGQLALFPLLPIVMTIRSLRYAASSRRTGGALLTLPVILAGNFAWCAGEWMSHARLLWR